MGEGGGEGSVTLQPNGILTELRNNSESTKESSLFKPQYHMYVLQLRKADTLFKSKASRF